jgi:hypothetical protein
MVEVNPASWLHNAGAVHTAAQLRISASALSNGVTTGITSRGGINLGFGAALRVTQTGAGAMSVDVASGIAHVPGDESAAQGTYVCINDAAVTLTIATADGADDRIDAVVATVRDSFYSGGDDDWLLQVITGTAEAVPSLPTLPNNSLLLAEVLVQASVTTILDADITDRRIFIGAPGLMSVADDVERDALSNKYESLSVWRRDLKRSEVYDGTEWESLQADFLLIGEQQLTVANATLVVASIPGVFRCLHVEVDASLTTAGMTTANLRFNSDTSTNYWYGFQFVDAAGTVTAAGNDAATQILVPTIGSSGMTLAVDIIGYHDLSGIKGCTMNGFARSGSGATQHRWVHGGGAWVSGGSAINEVRLVANSNTFTAGSSMRVYGIR